MSIAWWHRFPAPTGYPVGVPGLAPPGTGAGGGRDVVGDHLRAAGDHAERAGVVQAAGGELSQDEHGGAGRRVRRDQPVVGGVDGEPAERVVPPQAGLDHRGAQRGGRGGRGGPVVLGRVDKCVRREARPPCGDGEAVDGRRHVRHAADHPQLTRPDGREQPSGGGHRHGVQQALEDMVVVAEERAALRVRPARPHELDHIVRGVDEQGMPHLSAFGQVHVPAETVGRASVGSTSRRRISGAMPCVSSSAFISRSTAASESLAGRQPRTRQPRRGQTGGAGGSAGGHRAGDPGATPS